MARNFIACDREQELLLPPSVREWLPEEHLAWFVLDAVGEMDLGAFYAGYRDDGWGRAAHDPAMMVALFVYAYAIGVCSSRAIERRCLDDVAFRVMTANHAPDHATIARFRVRHEAAIAGLFGAGLERGSCGRICSRPSPWPVSTPRQQRESARLRGSRRGATGPQPRPPGPQPTRSGRPRLGRKPPIGLEPMTPSLRGCASCSLEFGSAPSIPTPCSVPLPGLFRL